MSRTTIWQTVPRAVSGDTACNPVIVSRVPPRGNLFVQYADSPAKKKCGLIAMTTHGHRFISDLFYGSAGHKVRHETEVPVLLRRVPLA